ncbi:MAG: helix-turn-helix domain-containing protein, partial [Staphylococcus sp.]|nr:helix-turn-helix domain-containing protein [Staphylococcus sp.]
KKSHQTFFDASSQQLLSLYHSLPKLKYQTFERLLNKNDIKELNIKVHPRFTYDSLNNTFKCIQLLIQTISQYLHHQLKFVPMNQQVIIQNKVKKVYGTIIENDLIKDFENEVTDLFQAISLNNNNKCYLHYYLHGYDEPMYTRQQVSLIENISISKLYTLELNNLVTLGSEIENKQRYPILSECIILSSLLNKTSITQQYLHQGLSLNEIAIAQNVKLNTIEDHILELFIKGYEKNYENYVGKKDIFQFTQYYTEHKGERLKRYKQEFDHLSYFEIKLMIVGIERGEMNVREQS